MIYNPGLCTVVYHISDFSRGWLVKFVLHNVEATGAIVLGTPAVEF